MRMELYKALMALVVSLVTLALGWLVGQRLTIAWNLVQKRRESELANVQQFYLIYGEFREVSKTWRLMKRTDLVVQTTRAELRWSLLVRACALESKLESVNIKLATEKKMTPDDLLLLGLFRQALQRLRESIRDDVEVASTTRGPEHEFFNRLAARVATLISSESQRELPSADLASEQLRAVTQVALTDFDQAVKNFSSQVASCRKQ